VSIANLARRAVGRVRSIGRKGHLHLDIRRSMIASHLEQAGHSSVVIVGDSRVESARLPSEIDGHNVVNAGIGGATIELVERVVLPLVENAFCIVIAAGVNNAKVQPVTENFEAVLSRAFDLSASKAKRVVLTTIPPVLADAPLGVGYYSPRKISELNRQIRELAQQKGCVTIDLASIMAGPDGNLKPGYSKDGVHLSADGYTVWTKSLVGGLSEIFRRS
jgi:lysophospholipase L1-like esterase